MKRLISLTLTICMVVTMLASLTFSTSAAPEGATVLFAEEFAWTARNGSSAEKSNTNYTKTYEDGSTLNTTKASSKQKHDVGTYTDSNGESNRYAGFGRDTTVTMTTSSAFTLDDTNKDKILIAEFEHAYSYPGYLWSSSKYVNDTRVYGKIQFGDILITHASTPDGTVYYTDSDTTTNVNGQFYHWVFKYYYDGGWKYDVTCDGAELITGADANVDSINTLIIKPDGGSRFVKDGTDSSASLITTDNSNGQTGCKTQGNWIADVEIYTLSNNDDEEPEDPIIPTYELENLFWDKLNQNTRLGYDSSTDTYTPAASNVTGTTWTNKNGSSSDKYDHSNVETGVPGIGRYSMFGRNGVMTATFAPFEINDANKNHTLQIEFDAKFNFAGTIYNDSALTESRATYKYDSVQIGGYDVLSHYGSTLGGIYINGQTQKDYANNTWNHYKVKYYYDSSSSSWKMDMYQDGEKLVDGAAPNSNLTSISTIAIKGNLGSKYIKLDQDGSSANAVSSNSGIGFANLSVIKNPDAEYSASDMIIQARLLAKDHDENSESLAYKNNAKYPEAAILESQYESAYAALEEVYDKAISMQYESATELNSAKAVAISALKYAVDACKDFDRFSNVKKLSFVVNNSEISAVAINYNKVYQGNAKLYVAKYKPTGEMLWAQVYTVTPKHLENTNVFPIDTISLAEGEYVKAFLWSADGKYAPITTSYKIDDLTQGTNVTQNTAIALELVPLYESASVYVSGDVTKDDIVEVYYRKVGEGEVWTKAFDPAYNEAEELYATAIVGLLENTEYEVAAVVNSQYNTAVTKTWNSDIATLPKTEYKLEDIINSMLLGYKVFEGGYVTRDSSTGAIKFASVEGSENNWIVIDCSGYPITCTDNQSSVALTIQESKYIIFKNLTIKGGQTGIYIPRQSSFIRIIEADISGWGRMYTSVVNETSPLKDINGDGINGDAAIKIGTGASESINGCSEGITVESCYIHNPNGTSNTWNSTYGGVSLSSIHPAGMHGMFVQARSTVVRWNDIVGDEEHRFNDAIEGYGNFKSWGGFAKDCDIYGNFLAFGQDDGVELDGRAQNIRFYNNRITNFYSGISTAGTLTGPSYIFNNVIHDLRTVTGESNLMMKNGEHDDYTVAGTRHIINNTFVAEEYDSKLRYGNTSGIRTYGIGRVGWYNAFTRNNIIITASGRHAINNSTSNADGSNAEKSSFDNDVIWSFTSSPDMSKLVTTTTDSFSSDSDAEAEGILGLPDFTNRANGVYTLNSADTVAKGNAISINGFLNGGNIGALSGTDSLIPIRPIPVNSDKYIIKLMSANATETVTLTSKSTSAMPFTVDTNDDVINVTPSANSIPAGGKVTFTVSLKDSTLPAANTHYPASTDDAYKYRDKAYDAVFMVRFENGISVPVLVKIVRAS